jgi:hypothetical protein
MSMEDAWNFLSIALNGRIWHYNCWTFGLISRRITHSLCSIHLSTQLLKKNTFIVRKIFIYKTNSFQIKKLGDFTTIAHLRGFWSYSLNYIKPEEYHHLFLLPWRWRRYVPPKRRLKLNGLHGVISQKTILFITTSVKTYIWKLQLAPELITIFKESGLGHAVTYDMTVFYHRMNNAA